MLKSLKTIGCASLLLFFGVGSASAFAQTEEGGRNSREPRRVQAGAREPNRFPGVGSYDAWQSALPEFRAANRCMRNKQWDQAIAHFKASIDLYEYQPHAWLNMGRALQRKGADVADQEQCFRKALKLDQTNWHAWKELANVLYITKRFGEAREALASAIQLNPPAQGRQTLEKMIQDVDSARRDADTLDRGAGGSD